MGSLTDKILINNMHFYAYHGVSNKEKSLGQRFEVDIEVNVSTKLAAENDDLSKTIDYTLLFEIAKKEILNRKYDLVESIAENIAKEVLLLSGIYSTKVRIRKPNAPIANSFFEFVQIEICRSNHK